MICRHCGDPIGPRDRDGALVDENGLTSCAPLAERHEVAGCLEIPDVRGQVSYGDLAPVCAFVDETLGIDGPSTFANVLVDPVGGRWNVSAPTDDYGVGSVLYLDRPNDTPYSPSQVAVVLRVEMGRTTVRQLFPGRSTQAGVTVLSGTTPGDLRRRFRVLTRELAEA